VFHRAELEVFVRRSGIIARSLRLGATMSSVVVGVATCVNVRAAPDDTRQLPGVVVTQPDGAAAPLRPDMRPLLGSDSAYFIGHPLMVPVDGVNPSQLTDTFHSARSGGRIHMATDIMALRGTPVLAASNGRIIKLATSGAGGIGIYMADASGRYVEYYAHLMGYAPNLKEGQPVQEGDVIGFVGSTGNASPDAPHLHFQVMRGDANYWNGTPLDVRAFITKPGRMRD
jgi:peptidoglycan LD-endopeptidase LytH